MFCKFKYLAVAVVSLCATVGFSAQETQSIPPLGLPEMPVPEGSAINPSVLELGRHLFFDKQLSGDGQIACASCHIPEKAFTDGRPLAQGVGGRQGSRKTPSVINAGYNAAQFWDGRRVTLEEQVLDPFFNPNEHGIADKEELLRTIRQDAAYSPLFKKAFGIEAKGISTTHVSKALATFVRSLVAGDSPVDRYLYAGDKQALSPGQVRGLELFRGTAQCSTCHIIGEHAALLMDGDYHSMSIGFDELMPKIAELSQQAARATPEELDRLIISNPDAAALGRFMITLDPQDIGKFKTPSLRNVTLVAPYMHDGSVATLEEAVDREIYYRGQLMGRPLILTPSEKEDLIAFLKALSSTHLPR